MHTAICVFVAALLCAIQGEADGAPNLVLRHGVVRSTNPAVSLSPSGFLPPSFASFVAFNSTTPSKTVAADVAGKPASCNASTTDGGDILTFAVIVSNTGDSPANGVVVSVTPPSGLAGANATTALTVVFGDGSLASFNQLSGGIFGLGIAITKNLSTAVLDGSDVLIVLYDLVVTSAVQLPAAVSVGRAVVAFGAPANTTIVANSMSVTFEQPTFTVAVTGANVTSTSSPLMLTIGSWFELMVMASLPQGFTSNLTIMVTVPALSGSACASLQASLASAASGITMAVGSPTVSSTTLSGDLIVIVAVGNVTVAADGQGGRRVVSARVNMTVLDSAPLVAGVFFYPTAAVSYAVPAMVLSTRNVTIAIAEPSLSFDSLTVAPPSGAVEGGVQFASTVAISALSCSYCSRAYSAVVSVVSSSLPSRLTVMQISVSSVPVGVSAVIESAHAIVLSKIPPGSRVVIAFNTTIGSVARAGESFLMDVQIASFQSVVGGGRTYAAAVVRSHSFIVKNFTLSTSFVTSMAETADNIITVGEMMTVSQSVTLPHGSSAPVCSFRYFAPDNVTAAFIPISVTLTFGSALTNSTLSTGTYLVSSNPAGVDVTAVGTAIVSIGSIVNAPDGVVDARDILQVAVTLALKDVAAVANSVAGSVRMTMASDLTSLSAAIQWSAVEPSLSVHLTSAPLGGVDAADTVTHALVLSHVAGSASPAFVLASSVTLPPAHVIVGSISCAVWNSTIDSDEFVIAFVNQTGGGLAVNVSAPRMSVGNSITCSFNTTLAPAIAIGSSQTYRADVAYSSAPSSLVGRPYKAQAQQVLAVNAPTIAVVPNGIGLAETADPLVAIAEVIRVTVTVQIPEGTSSNFTLSIAGPSALGTAQTTLHNATVLHVGSSLSVALNASRALDPPLAVYGVSNDTATFAFGPLTNWPDNAVNANDTIVVHATFTAGSHAANIRGASLQFTATAALGSNLNPVVASGTLIVAEPVLAVSGVTVAASGDALDEIVFNVTFSHSPLSTAPAFDVAVLQAADILVPALNGTASATVSSLPADSVAWINATAVVASHWRLLTNESLSLVFRCRIVQRVLPSASFANAGTATFGSVPGGGRSASVSGATPFRIDDPTPAMSLLSKSVPDVLIPLTVIHETLEFRAVARLPESSTPFFVEIYLPTKNNALQMIVVNATVLRVGRNLQNSSMKAGDAFGTISANLFSYNQIGNVLSLSFGNVTNLADNTRDDGDEVEVQVFCFIPDVAENVRGEALLLRTSIRYGFLSAIIVFADTTLTVVEPTLAPLISTNATLIDAADDIEYIVTVPHAGASNSPAFKCAVDVTIPASFLLRNSSITAVIVSNDSVPSFAILNGGQRIRFSFSRLLVGGSLIARFVASVRQSVHPDDQYSPVVAGTHNSTMLAAPYQGRAYGPVTAQSLLTVGTPSVTLILAGTSIIDTIGNSVAVHEVFTLEVRVVLPEAQSAVSISLVTSGAGGEAPVQLTTAVVVSVGGSITGARIQTGDAFGANAAISPVIDASLVRTGFVFNLNDVTNVANNIVDDGDSVLLRVQGSVRDVVANLNGAVITATATVQYDGKAHIASTSLVVVEPVLTTTSSALQGSPLDGGDVVTFAFSVGHTAVTSASAAFNVTATITLDPSLQFLQPTVSPLIVGGSDTGAATFFYDSVHESVTVRLARLSLNASLSVVFNATLRQSAAPSSANKAAMAVSFDSSPSDAPLAGRAYVAPATSAAVFTVGATAVFVAKSTSLTSTTGLDMAINERIVLLVNVSLPEGMSPNVTVVVSLPVAGGISLASVVSAGVVLVGPKLNASLSSPVSLLTLGSAPDRAIIRLGRVRNTADNTGVDVVSVEVDAVVRDATANIDGSTLNFDASVTFENGTGTLTLPLTRIGATVRRPVLVMVSGVAPSRVSLASVVRFNVTISHAETSTATAFDLWATFTLDPLLGLATGSLRVGGANLLSAFNATSTGRNTTLAVELASVDVGSVAWIYFTATVSRNVTLGTVLRSFAFLNYTTVNPLPGFPGRIASASAIFPDLAVNFVHVDASLTSTSVPETTGATLCVGETLTLSVTASILGGNASFLMSLVIPRAGGVSLFSVVSATLNTIGRNINGSLLSAGAALDQSPRVTSTAGLLTFDFGVVSHAQSFPLDSDDDATATIVLALSDAPSVSAGSTASLLANATYEGFTVSKAVTIAFVEPFLSLTVSRASRAQGDAGDAFAVALAVAHTASSTAAAHDVTVEVDLALMSAGVPIVVAVGSGDPQPTITVTNGTAAVLTFAKISLGSTVTVSLTTYLSNSAPASAVLTKNVTLSYFSSPAAGLQRRERRASNSSIIIVSPPSVTMSVQSTDLSETVGMDVAIGERVTFAVSVVCPEGVVTRGSVRLSLLGRLAGVPIMTIESASVASVSSKITTQLLSAGDQTPSSGNIVLTASTADAAAMDTVDFTLGDIANQFDNLALPPDTVVLTVTARVLNRAGSMRDLASPAECVLRYTAGASGASFTLNSTALVTVRETRLQISLGCTPSTGDAGDSVVCTATISHLLGSTVAAFHVNVTGALAPFFDRSPGGLTYVIDGGTPVTISPDASVAAESPSLAVGSTMTVRSVCTLSSITAPGVVANQTVALSYASRPRAGMASGSFRDYDGGTSTFSFSTLSPPNVTCVTDFNWPGAGGLVVGLTSVSRMTLQMTEGRAPVKLRLELPAIDGNSGSRRAVSTTTSLLSILDVSLISVGAMLTSIEHNPPVLSFLSRDSLSSSAGPLGALGLSGFIPDSVVIDFGIVVNSPDNVVNGKDSIVVGIESVVRDIPENVNGRRVLFSALADLQTASPVGRSAVAIAEPDLLVNKTPTLPTADINYVRFTLIVRPTSDSLAPAYVVRLNDTLPLELTLVAGSLRVPQGLNHSVILPPESSDNTTRLLFWTDDLSLFPLSTLNITYDALLSSSVAPPARIDTFAVLTYAALPANFTFARKYGPVTSRGSVAKEFAFVRVSEDDHLGTILGTILGTLIGAVAAIVFIVQGLSPERRAKLWPKPTVGPVISPLLGSVPSAGRGMAGAEAGLAVVTHKTRKGRENTDFSEFAHVEGISAYAYMADDALRASERLEDERFEEQRALIADFENARTELYMRRLGCLLGEMVAAGDVDGSLETDLAERAHGALLKAQKAAASVAKSATEKGLRNIAEAVGEKKGRLAAPVDEDGAESRAIDRWAELESRELQGRVAADEHFEIRKALDDITVRVVGEAAARAQYSPARVEDIKGAIDRDIADLDSRLEAQMVMLTAAIQGRTLRRTGLLEVRFALKDERGGFRRARAEQGALLIRRLASEKGLSDTVRAEADDALRKEADHLDKSRALFLAKRDRSLAEKQSQALHDRLQGIVERAADVAAREPTTGNFQDDVSVRLDRRSALFEELQGVTEEADNADIAEWRTMWGEFEAETDKLFASIETRAFAKLAREGASNGDVEVALEKHRDGISKFEAAMSAQRQRQEMDLRRRLAERVAAAATAATQEHEDMAGHRDQGDRVMQRLVDAQVALGDEERDRILRDHENDVNRLVRVLNLSKQRQEQTLRDKMAERRRERLAVVRRQQDEERSTELRRALESSPDEIAHCAARLAEKQNKELETVAETLEEEERVEADRLQDELMKQREAALKSHEDKMAEELSRLQMDKAREEIQIRQAQRVLKNLEEDLVRDLAGKGALSDEASDRALKEHQEGLERLDAAMLDQRQKQQRLLQERLAAKRRRREEALQRKHNDEISRDTGRAESALSGDGPERPQTAQSMSNPTVMRLQMTAKHEMELASLRKNLEMESRQANEDLQRRMDMERLAALESQELRLLGELARGGRLSGDGLEQLLNRAFGQRGQQENRERIRRIVLPASK